MWVDLKLLHHLLEYHKLVFLVVDDEGAVEAGVVGLPSQYLGAQGVEGGDAEVAAHIPQVSKKWGGRITLALAEEPFPHLTRGLVGESYGRDATRADTVCHDQMGYAMSDDPRLPAAGTRQYQKRPIDRLHRFPLRRVEVFQYVYVHLLSEGL